MNWASDDLHVIEDQIWILGRNARKEADFQKEACLEKAAFDFHALEISASFQALEIQAHEIFD